MNIEIHLEDVFGPPRSKKACVHAATYNRLFKAADHIHVSVRTCTQERYMIRSSRCCCCLHKNIFTRKDFEECDREETAHGI